MTTDLLASLGPAVDQAREDRRKAHVHVADRDTAEGPDHTGALFVTEHCACGAVVRTYRDAVL